MWCVAGMRAVLNHGVAHTVVSTIGPPRKHPANYRGTSLIRKRSHPGPYRRPMPRVLGGSWGGGRFLMGEVPLYPAKCPAYSNTGETCTRRRHTAAERSRCTKFGIKFRCIQETHPFHTPLFCDTLWGACTHLEGASLESRKSGDMNRS